MLALSSGYECLANFHCGFLPTRPRLFLEDPLANTLSLIGSLGAGTSSPCGTSGPPRLQGSAFTTFDAHWFRPPMGSSGKRGQLPTSVVPNQQTHPRTGRLYGTYYTLNAIPHPSLSTASKHLERSRLSRLAGRDPCHGVRVLAQGHPPRAAPRVLHDSKVQPLPPSMLTGFALPWARQGSGDSSRPVCQQASRAVSPVTTRRS
ncbi:hypothetical protein V6N11_028514 [Hibiscus sabdariffa]|uniref:Uncharacterized protein n=1 Tax=Hibiscus sabdariffa TaxID=183260 RepID=A0ABR2NEG7_9ROSI